MSGYPPALINLIRELSRLPGIGPKSAQRLAFHLFDQPREDIERLASVLLGAKKELRTCPLCLNITDGAAEDTCNICTDEGRNRQQICVVEEPADVIAIERSGEYNGLYHVLHGVLSPMNGVGPEQLHIKALLPRVQVQPVQSPTTKLNEEEISTTDAANKADVMEVILAMGTTVEGDATALYLQRLLEPFAVRLSRIAYGLPVGGSLEYVDEITLGRALTGRQKLSD